jgi:hypothetical protein
MRVLYFGCHRESGHYFWKPGMRDRDCYPPQPLPWQHVDMALCPGVTDPEHPHRNRTRPEVQGEAALHHKDGWTALAFWNRSVDTRPASNSAFIAEGEHDFETMMQLARDHFPEVVRRLPFEVRLAQ